MIRPNSRMLKWRWQTVIDEKDRIWLDGDQSCYFNRLMDLAQPIEDNDAVTKRYVDTATERYPIGNAGNFPIIAPDGSGINDSNTSPSDYEAAGTTALHIITPGAHLAYAPAHYARSNMWCSVGLVNAADRRSVKTPNRVTVNINETGYEKVGSLVYDLDLPASWDTIAGTDYSIAANRAGKQFYIYACQPVSGNVPVFVISAASTFPSGYNAVNSRQIVRFHCLCLSVGAIAGHQITGLVTGDILPRSFQDLGHRPKAGFINGIVWGGVTDFDTLNYAPVWKAIYMASGTGASTASIFGAAASVSRDWNAFASDFGSIGCRMMDDAEFQVLCAGIEEEVNIAGSANPTTTGGHVSTTGRRMISNIGSEDDIGVWWQWLSTQGFRVDFDGSVMAAAKTANIVHAAAPGGNPVYVDYDVDGTPYLCCTMATTTADKWVAFSTTHKALIKHLAAIPATAVQLYFDEDAVQPNRLLAAVPHLKNVYVAVQPNAGYKLQITYNAAPGTPGVAVNFDDGADQRLEFISPTAALGVVDIVLDAIAWAYYNLAGTVGSLYRQGIYGDVKLLGGGHWATAADAGSRARHAVGSRWNARTSVGSRFVAEPQ
jgi:hypothetical protein